MYPRLPDRDPAVAPQGELLAAKQNFFFALDGDIGAVRAVVPEHKLVVAPVYRAMLTGPLRVRNDEVASPMAPDDDGVCAAQPGNVLSVVLQAEPGHCLHHAFA